MAKKEPYDMTNSYARMERDKRKAIGNPNKNVHHKKNGSNYQKDTGSMVRSTSARQEPEKMSTTVKVLIGVVFVVLDDVSVAVLRVIMSLSIALRSRLASVVVSWVPNVWFRPLAEGDDLSAPCVGMLK